MNCQKIQDALIAEIEASRLNVVAAYLFGSCARNEQREESDIDLALLLDQSPSSDLENSGIPLAQRLALALGKEVDLVILNSASVDLIHRIFRDGLLLIDENKSKRIEFEVKKRNEYFDLLPVITKYRRGNLGIPK